MGAWAHCDICKNELMPPGADQVVGLRPYCCNRCWQIQDMRQTKDELIVELAERISQIERALWPDNED